jgi:hypothetical protein
VQFFEGTDVSVASGVSEKLLQSAVPFRSVVYGQENHAQKESSSGHASGNPKDSDELILCSDVST